MIVVPAPGRAVRDPRTMMLLKEEGRDVNERDPFWARRLRDGDVVQLGAPEGTSARNRRAPAREA
jgi:Protein of unknown function (DUF2635)